MVTQQSRVNLQAEHEGIARSYFDVESIDAADFSTVYDFLDASVDALWDDESWFEGSTRDAGDAYGKKTDDWGYIRNGEYRLTGGLQIWLVRVKKVDCTYKAYTNCFKKNEEVWLSHKVEENECSEGNPTTCGESFGPKGNETLFQPYKKFPSYYRYILDADKPSLEAKETIEWLRANDFLDNQMFQMEISQTMFHASDNMMIQGKCHVCLFCLLFCLFCFEAALASQLCLPWN